MHHFYNVDKSLYMKLQYHKMHVQAVSLFMFVRFCTYSYSDELYAYSFVLHYWWGRRGGVKLYIFGKKNSLSSFNYQKNDLKHPFHFMKS